MMKYHLRFDFEFTPNTFPGQYFALEGIDGSGKSTQAEKLADFFRKKGKDVLITKEPTDSLIGILIKKIIHEEIRVPAQSLQYLFAADRALHLRDEVIPALQKGTIVISDRSFWSAVAYGIMDLGRLSDSISSGRDDVAAENKYRLLVAYNILTIYHGFLVPDKTFVIRLPADIAMQRVLDRKQEQTLYEHTEKLAGVEREYEWLAGCFSEKLVLIDGIRSVDEVFQQIEKYLSF